MVTYKERRIVWLEVSEENLEKLYYLAESRRLSKVLSILLDNFLSESGDFKELMFKVDCLRRVPKNNLYEKVKERKLEEKAEELQKNAEKIVEKLNENNSSNKNSELVKDGGDSDIIDISSGWGDEVSLELLEKFIGG